MFGTASGANEAELLMSQAAINRNVANQSKACLTWHPPPQSRTKERREPSKQKKNRRRKRKSTPELPALDMNNPQPIRGYGSNANALANAGTFLSASGEWQWEGIWRSTA